MDPVFRVFSRNIFYNRTSRNIEPGVRGISFVMELAETSSLEFGKFIHWEWLGLPPSVATTSVHLLRKKKRMLCLFNCRQTTFHRGQRLYGRRLYSEDTSDIYEWWQVMITSKSEKSEEKMKTYANKIFY